MPITQLLVIRETDTNLYVHHKLCKVKVSLEMESSDNDEVSHFTCCIPPFPPCENEFQSIEALLKEAIQQFNQSS